MNKDINEDIRSQFIDSEIAFNESCPNRIDGWGLSSSNGPLAFLLSKLTHHVRLPSKVVFCL